MHMFDSDRSKECISFTIKDDTRGWAVGAVALGPIVYKYIKGHAKKSETFIFFT